MSPPLYRKETHAFVWPRWKIPRLRTEEIPSDTDSQNEAGSATFAYRMEDNAVEGSRVGGWNTIPWKKAAFASAPSLGKEFTVERIVPRLDPASGALSNFAKL